MDKGNENLTAGEAETERERLKNDKLKTPNFFDAAFSLFNARPILSGAVGIVAGIASVYFSVEHGFAPIALFLIFSLATAFFAYFFANEKSKKLCAVVFAAFALFGVVRGEIELFSFINCRYFGANVNIVAEVEDVLSENGYVRLKISDIEADGEKIGGHAYVYAFGDSFYGALPSRCDRISFTATLKKTADYSDGVYKSNCFAGGIYYSGNAEGKIRKTGVNRNVFEECSFYVAKYLKSAVSEENYGIALAMILGDSSRLKDEQINAFRLSGLAHVFAVSGLHIGLFSGLFAIFAKLFKQKGLKKCLAVLVPTLFYVGICGFSSSAVRAFTMLAVIMLSELFGFKHDRLSALSVAALLIAMFSPLAVFSKGWQLSFAAVSGIILLCPMLERGTAPLKERAGKAVSVCLAAQLGTLPVLTDMCGYMSIIATFANLIVLPLLSLVYQLLAVSCVLGIPFYALGASESVLKIITFLPDNALSAISAAVTAVNYDKLILPFAFGAAALPYYLSLITVSDITNLNVKTKLSAVCAFLIAFVCFLP